MSHERRTYKETLTGYAYRLRNGDFYRTRTDGNWGAAPRNTVTVKNLSLATIFSTSLQGPPYDMPYMRGGKWVEVTRETVINWEPV